MRIQHYKREKTLGTFNFDCCQLYVCTMSDTKGRIYKGISLLWAGGASYLELLLPLSHKEALDFSRYLQSLLTGNVPSKHNVRPMRKWLSYYLLTFRMKFYEDAGDYIKCRMSINLSFMWGRVKKSSLQSCSDALNTLYQY